MTLNVECRFSFFFFLFFLRLSSLKLAEQQGSCNLPSDIGRKVRRKGEKRKGGKEGVRKGRLKGREGGRAGGGKCKKIEKEGRCKGGKDWKWVRKKMTVILKQGRVKHCPFALTLIH